MAKHAIGMMNNDKLKLVDIQKKAPRYRIAKPFLYRITSTLFHSFLLSNNFPMLQLFSMTNKMKNAI